MTGRRDSIQSYFDKALAEIPKPDEKISETLLLFTQQGFDKRETVALLGGHNIGKIGCEFIQPRLQNPDAAIPLDFLSELRRKCRDKNDSVSAGDESVIPRRMRESSPAMEYYQGLSSLAPSGGGFDTHYYEALVRGRGLLTAEMELMANNKTLDAVLDYLEDLPRSRIEFAQAMLKLSNLNVLVGSEGEVRRNCSRPEFLKSGSYC